MMVNISATVAGSDPRLDKIEIEGYDKDRSNHMGCVLLKTDERRLRRYANQGDGQTLLR